MRQVAGRLGGHVIWNGLAFGLARGFPLLSMMAAAKMLEPSSFGQLTLLYLGAASAFILIDGGYGFVLTRLLARDQEARPWRFRAWILTAAGVMAATSTALVMASAATLLLAPQLGLKEGWILESLPAATAYAVAGVGSAAVGAVLTAMQNFRMLSFVTGIGGAIGFAAFLFGVWRMGPAGGLLGWAIGHVIAVLVGTLIIRPIFQAAPAIPRRKAASANSRPYLSVMAKEATPALLTGLLWAPAAFLAASIVTAQSSLTDTGHFGVASQWFSIVMFLPMIVTQVLLTQFSRDVGKGNHKHARQLLMVSVGGLWLVIGLAAGVLALLASFILGLYGPEYAEDLYAFELMMLAGFIAAPEGSLANYLVAYGRYWTRLCANIAALVMLITTAVLLGKLGAEGLALAHLASNLTRVVWMAIASWRLRPTKASSGGESVGA